MSIINKINKNYWKNKKVLVTGHSGFKGGWLCLSLLQLGSEVIGLSLPPSTNPSFYNLIDLNKRIKSNFVDIRDYNKVKDIIRENNPEIIFHLAAQPLVLDSYSNPLETYSTNVMGTVNLLEAARKIKGINSIICITTDKCYKNEGGLWGFRETDVLGGDDPYSNSKACAELVCHSYNTSFFEQNGVKLATARAGNIIGGGDWSENRLFPDILKSLQQNNPPEIRNPDHTRPWQHVIDPILGYLILAQELENNFENLRGGINFGPNFNSKKSVGDIVDITLSIWGSCLKWKKIEIAQPKESHELSLDITKANKILKWSPLINLEDGIRMTIAWHKAWIKENDMYKISTDQINKYI